MKMKMSWMGLVLGLALLIAVSSDATTLALGSPEKCCFSFANFKIPKENILKIERTHTNCPTPGYIVTAKRGQICKKEVDVN